MDIKQQLISQILTVYNINSKLFFSQDISQSINNQPTKAHFVQHIHFESEKLLQQLDKDRMQQSFSNQNLMGPFKLTHNIPYNSNYYNNTTLPKQQCKKQLSQNYPKQSSFNHAKQHFSTNYQQYPTYSNHYIKNNQSSLQPISIKQYSQVISPQLISNQFNNELSLEKHFPQNLKNKIKQIKTALRIAQERNQQLHQKLNSQKKASNQQIASYQKDLYRYKSLYEMLVDNFDKKADELNEMRKELQMRRVEVNELRRVIDGNCALKTSTKMNLTEHPNSEQINMKQLSRRHQQTFELLSHENKVLRQQLVLKRKKLSEYEKIIQTYQTQQKLHKSHFKTVSQLQVRINQLEMENEKLVQQRGVNRTRVQQLQIEMEGTKNSLMSVQNELSRTLTERQQLKITTSQLQNELLSTQQLVKDYESGQLHGKWKHMFDQISLKYNDLLQTNYETQKEFEKELHLITNEVQRREILKYSHT